MKEPIGAARVAAGIAFHFRHRRDKRPMTSLCWAARFTTEIDFCNRTNVTFSPIPSSGTYDEENRPHSRIYKILLARIPGQNEKNKTKNGEIERLEVLIRAPESCCLFWEFWHNSAVPPSSWRQTGRGKGWGQAHGRKSMQSGSLQYNQFHPSPNLLSHGTEGGACVHVYGMITKREEQAK